MIKRFLPALVAVTLLAAACADTTAPPPAVAPPAHPDRFLVNPRTGYAPAATPVEKRFEAAWRNFLAGDLPAAQRQLADLTARNPEYLPAALAQAAIDLKQGNLDGARAIVQRVENQAPDYTTAHVYEAEIAMAEHNDRAALDIYRSVAQKPDAPPTTAERVTMLQNRVFEQLFTAAQTAPDTESIRLLHEALDLQPGSVNARVMLANKLIAQHQIEDARQILDPVVNSPDLDRPDVQQSLAEIEVGRGQFQQAITRYDRLVHRDPRYAPRLEEIKQQWNAANMPPQYQRAFETDAIDRSDFAVLAYWKLTSVRFAQNLGAPPIAIDIEGIPGREEIIRAIALGLYDVDPVTRRVSPLRPVNAGTLERLSARLLAIQGAPCTRPAPAERDETLRAQKVLNACGITDPGAALPPDSPVSGKAAATMLDQIEKLLQH